LATAKKASNSVATAAHKRGEDKAGMDRQTKRKKADPTNKVRRRWRWWAQDRQTKGDKANTSDEVRWWRRA
jgi:hypothetical protein